MVSLPVLISRLVLVSRSAPPSRPDWALGPSARCRIRAQGATPSLDARRLATHLLLIHSSILR